MSGDPERDLRLLQDVAVIANQAGSLEEAFLRTMRRVADFNGWAVGFVHWVTGRGRLEPSRLWYSAREPSAAEAALREHLESTPLEAGEELPGRALASGEHRCLADLLWEGGESPRVALARAAGLRGAIAFPVRVGDEAAAVIEHFATDPIDPDDTLVETLAYVGTQLGRSVERERSERRLGDLAAREQQRIGEELHAGLGQQLTGLSLLARHLTRTLALEPGPVRALAAELEEGLETARRQTRRLAKGLLMTALDDRTLVEALREIADELCLGGVDCRVEADPGLELTDRRLAVTLFRIAREALANAVRHAEAEEIVVRLSRVGGEIVLEVADDGRGLPAGVDPGSDDDQDGDPDGEGGLGLRILRERAAQVGGRLEIESEPGRGTCVRVAAAEGSGRGLH